MLLNPLEQIRKMRTRSLSRTIQETAVYLTKNWLRTWSCNIPVILFGNPWFRNSAFVIYLLSQNYCNTFPTNQTLFRPSLVSFFVKTTTVVFFFSSLYFVRFFHKSLPKIQGVKSYFLRTHCITDIFFEQIQSQLSVILLVLMCHQK